MIFLLVLLAYSRAATLFPRAVWDRWLHMKAGRWVQEAKLDTAHLVDKVLFSSYYDIGRAQRWRSLHLALAMHSGVLEAQLAFEYVHLEQMCAYQAALEASTRKNCHGKPLIGGSFLQRVALLATAYSDQAESCAIVGERKAWGRVLAVTEAYGDAQVTGKVEALREEHSLDRISERITGETFHRPPAQ